MKPLSRLHSQLPDMSACMNITGLMHAHRLPLIYKVHFFILFIRSVIIVQVRRVENSPRGAHPDRHEAPEATTSCLDPQASQTVWPRSSCNLLPPSPTCFVSRDPGSARHALLPPTRHCHCTALIKLSLLQARLAVGGVELILSNYTDVTVAFQHVIKIWPASSVLPLFDKGRKN